MTASPPVRTLQEMLDTSRLAELIEGGYIRVKEHPREPLRLYDYGPKVQFARLWTPETRACRGLVAHVDGRILARPFPKFFNVGEHEPGEIPWHEPFDVLSKMDGSLGILYREPSSGRLAICTRGSFTSDQALHATALWQDRYASVTVPVGQTWLFEIIYPTNRIVVDYRGLDDLVLLAVLDTATGTTLPQPEHWPGPLVPRHDGVTDYDTILALGNGKAGDEAEGFVLCFSSGLRAKAKFADYVRLHRLVTGVSTKTVWEHLSAGRPLDELLDRVPDEFYKWLMSTAAELQGRHDDMLSEAKVAMADPRVDRSDRRATAAFFMPHPLRALLFRLLDGKDASPLIWRQLKPAFAKPFRTDDDN